MQVFWEESRRSGYCPTPVYHVESADWHSSEQFNRMVQAFHDRNARQPLLPMNEARTIHTRYLAEIERQLRSLGICDRLEYRGSSYEGVKVAKSSSDYDLEFDVMMIIKRHRYQLEIESIPGRAGFARLKSNDPPPNPRPDRNSSYNLFGRFDENYLNAETTACKFYGELQKCINNSPVLRSVRLRRHGPAIQMDVQCDELFYSVDIVPAYEVDNQRYVAKPPKGEMMPDMLTWQRSFSVEEKDKLLHADRNNGCRKKVLRILKVLRNREAGLDPLSSYHLKTALFREMDNPTVPTLTWNERDLGQRLMGVLGQLELCLAARNLPNYFVPDINLLSSMTPSCIDNVRDRIKRLNRSEHEMSRVLAV